MKPWDQHAFGVPAEPVHCEQCETEIDPGRDLDLCDSCYDKTYCECGAELETPGEPDFCPKCR